MLWPLPYLDNDPSRITFEDELEKLRQRHQFFLFGYVLMPNHVHLLLSEPKLHPLSKTLNVLKAETSRRLKGDRKQFWQTRYYDFNVLTHRKHVEKLKYIHRNPVERGLVEKPEDWPWSSYRHYLTGEPSRVEIESEWTWNLREKQPDLAHSSPPPKTLASTQNPRRGTASAVPTEASSAGAYLAAAGRSAAAGATTELSSSAAPQLLPRTPRPDALQ